MKGKRHMDITLEKAIVRALDVIGQRDEYPYNFYPRSAGRMLPLLQDVTSVPTGRLIDVGCGAGFMASVTAQFGFEVHCLDTFKYIDEKVIREFNLKYVESAIESPPTPYEENFFDIVILSEVLEHFNYSPLIPLKEIYRILRPGGLLFLTTPNVASIFFIDVLFRGQNIFIPIYVMQRDGWRTTELKDRTIQDKHSRLYTIKEIRYLMNECGFSIVKYRSLVRWDPSTRKFPRNLALALAKKIVATTNSRLWGDTIYIVAKKPEGESRFPGPPQRGGPEPPQGAKSKESFLDGNSLRR